MKHIILSLLIIFSGGKINAQEDSVTYVDDATDVFEEDTVNAENLESMPVTLSPVEPESLENTRQYSAGKIQVRNFDRAKWKEIVGATDYNEKKVEQEIETTSKPWGSKILVIIFYALIVGVVAFLLYFISRNTSFDFKFKTRQTETADFTAPVENIDDLDIQSLLKHALEAGNLRLAVRLYYLGLLKRLNEAGMIIWKKDKTNRDYLSELFLHSHHYEELKDLTQAYEAVWYGDHSLTPEGYAKLISGFESANNKINTPHIP